MEKKMQPRSRAESGQQQIALRGVEKETDRLLKAVQKTEAKERKTAANPAIMSAHIQAVSKKENAKNADSFIQNTSVQKISGEERKTRNIGLNSLEKQRLIRQYILEKKNAFDKQNDNAQKNDIVEKQSSTASEKVLDALSEGIDILEETVRELPVIGEDKAQNLAVTETDKSVELIAGAEKLAGRISKHYQEKKAIKQELERGFEIGESLKQLGENGQKAREYIYQKYGKTAYAVEGKAEKRNLSESRKLRQDLEKIDKKYNEKMSHTKSIQEMRELQKEKGEAQLKADKKHTKRLSKKTDKAVYRQIKKHGGVDSAALTAAVCSSAADNRINKISYRQQTAQSRKGISAGSLSDSRQLEEALKVRAENIGKNNRHIHVVSGSSKESRKSTKILKTDARQETIEKFVKKQEKETEKKTKQLEKKTKKRTEKTENKAAIRKAKMNFMIQTLLADEKNGDKTPGIELMKQIFTIESSSFIKRTAKKAGHILWAVVIGIAQFFISVLLSVASLFMTCLFPVILVGVCALTIYSAVAYIGGFFNTDGEGVLTVAQAEINLMDKANMLYGDFFRQISSYQNQTRVVKNTEREYIEETYTITYPYMKNPAKNDFLVDYFTMIAGKDAGDLTDGSDILPYLNINTAVEQDTLSQVFGQMNYFGAETYHETSRRELIGYEQKRVTEQVMTGYRALTESHTVSTGSFIYDYGTSAGTGSSIYLGVDMTESYEDYIQISEDLLSEKTMYCYLYTTSNNKIPLGCELSLDVTYKNNKNELVPVTLKMQVVGIDTSGENLYRNSPHIKLFNQTITKLEGSELLQAYRVLVYRRTRGIDRFGNLKSLTEYNYEITRQIPVYETRERYVDDTDRPIYRVYTYKKYSKPVYYLNASMWYARYSSSLSEEQKEIYQECVELYHDMTY